MNRKDGLPIQKVRDRRALLGITAAAICCLSLATFADESVASCPAYERASDATTIVDEQLTENAHARGHQLIQGLQETRHEHAFIGDVRGLGLMVGVEISGSDRYTSKELAEKIQTNCLDQKMLLLTCGTYGNVIRWIPPLVVSEDQIDKGLQIFANACDQANTWPKTSKE